MDPGVSGQFRVKGKSVADHFLIRLETDKADVYIIDKLEKKGIRVNALSEYYFTENDREHSFIINYSNLDVQKAEQAMQEICGILRDGR